MTSVVAGLATGTVATRCATVAAGGNIVATGWVRATGRNVEDIGPTGRLMDAIDCIGCTTAGTTEAVATGVGGVDSATDPRGTVAVGAGPSGAANTVDDAQCAGGGSIAGASAIVDAGNVAASCCGSAANDPNGCVVRVPVPTAKGLAMLPIDCKGLSAIVAFPCGGGGGGGGAMDVVGIKLLDTGMTGELPGAIDGMN